MAKAGKKKVEDVLAETVTNMTKDVSEAVKTAVSVAASGGDETTVLLRRLQQQYSRATLKIYRKGKNQRDELFVTLEGQDLKEIEAGGGLDTLCLTEGGTGQYSIHIIPPGANSEMQKVGPLNVTGAPTRMVPKSRELYDANQFGTMAGLPGFGAPVGPQGSQNLSGFGAPVGAPSGGATTITKGNAENTYQIKDLAAYMTQQSAETLRAQEQSADRMAMMQQQQQQQQLHMQMQMQQQQRESSQQMMTLLATMFQNNNQAPAANENAEIRVLKEQLDQMKHQREQDERFRAQERQMEELKRALEMQKVENSQPKGNPMLELLVPLMTSQQAQAQSQQTQLLEVMKMANDRPGEDEKMSNIFSTLTMSNQATMNMVMEIARSGLLGGGDDHPIRDAVLQGLDTLRDLGVAALTRDSGGEEEEEAQEVVVAPQQMPEAPVPQLEAPVEGNLGGVSEAPDLEGQEVLTDAELERLMRDSAFQKLLASLMNNDHVSEATARLYGHALSGNPMAAKWLSTPEAITAQVFEVYEMTELKTVDEAGEPILISKALIENMYNFADYMHNEGDPNKWAKTGYKPLKRKNKDNAPEEIEQASEQVESTEEIEEAPIAEPEETEESVSEEANEA